jgi:MraZ protein
MANDVPASYTDTFEHAFDAKGRITVPSEWRGELFETHLYLLPSGDRCVRVYPASWMGELQREMSTLIDADPKKAKIRALASLAQSTTWDAQGRIMVKEKLREGAGLKKEAVLVGSFDHFQIWGKDAWAARETIATNIEEGLAALGR